MKNFYKFFHFLFNELKNYLVYFVESIVYIYLYKKYKKIYIL